MSMTQGRVKQGSNPGQLAGVDPRLIAGEARDGGGIRVSSHGDQIEGRGHLRNEETRPHRMVRAGGARVERARRSRARGGAGIRV